MHSNYEILDALQFCRKKWIIRSKKKSPNHNMKNIKKRLIIQFSSSLLHHFSQMRYIHGFSGQTTSLSKIRTWHCSRPDDANPYASTWNIFIYWRRTISVSIFCRLHFKSAFNDSSTRFLHHIHVLRCDAEWCYFS